MSLKQKRDAQDHYDSSVKNETEEDEHTSINKTNVSPIMFLYSLALVVIAGRCKCKL